jgi:hypothetical protein
MYIPSVCMCNVNCNMYILGPNFNIFLKKLFGLRTGKKTIGYIYPMDLKIYTLAKNPRL